MEELAAGKAAIEAGHGPWTAHNAKLAPGLWTICPESVNFDEKVRRCLRVATDFFGGTLSGLRVLDLGAGEGGLSLEFAAHGANVVCVDGRRLNLAKAEFAASALGLHNIEFRCQDVRRLPTHERYDLVLCFGLLYHLDAESAVALLGTIGTVCERLLILDTHFSTRPTESIEVNGRRWRGHYIAEHEAAATSEEKAGRAWASLDNTSSFWFSKPSLLNLLGGGGFNSVYEVAFPFVFDFGVRSPEARYRYRDRLTLVAARSQAVATVTVHATAPRDVPEDLETMMVDWPITT